MNLSMMTWPEVDAHLKSGVIAVLPTGSTEQHGPMGLIGTDTICATAVGERAAEQSGAILVPSLGYTPAPFNTGFPGTISISPHLLTDMITEICQGLLNQGFLGVFIVNGHGANLAPIDAACLKLPVDTVRCQSWWNPPEVNAMRAELYGAWEGMHATPSEVAMTQTLHGARPAGAAATPPKKLSRDFILAHSGDRHGPPDEHRAAFPDGRVGSHSALATPEDGQVLLETAAREIAAEITQFAKARRNASDRP